MGRRLAPMQPNLVAWLSSKRATGTLAEPGVPQRVGHLAQETGGEVGPRRYAANSRKQFRGRQDVPYVSSPRFPFGTGTCRMLFGYNLRLGSDDDFRLPFIQRDFAGNRNNSPFVLLCVGKLRGTRRRDEGRERLIW